MSNRDEFTNKIKESVAKRAAYECSNPDCNQLCIGPTNTDLDNVNYIGKVAHITAAASGGPRYDPSLSVKDRKSAKNAIFLCSNCAEKIDKNNGKDYLTTLLKKWKIDHEEKIKERQKSKTTINKNFEPINIVPSPDDERIPILEVLVKNLTIEYYKKGFQKPIDDMIYNLIYIIDRFRPEYLNKFAPNNSVQHDKVISHYFNRIIIEVFVKKINKEEIVLEKVPPRGIFTHAGDLAYVIYNKMYKVDFKTENIPIENARKEYHDLIGSQNLFFNEEYKHNIFNEALRILEKENGIIRTSGPYTGSDCKEIYDILRLDRLQEFIKSWSLENLLKEIKR